MRLLIVTQALDQENRVLGFFHEWVAALAARVEHIEVIALSVGTYELPPNVSVHSLGKEKGPQFVLVYVWRFLSLACKSWKSYDTVFVHMNQEYVLIAGWFWKIFDMPIYLWRNHYAGTALTDIAALFCAKLFYTSTYSYTAKFRNAVSMPVGIDTDRFGVAEKATRTPRSLLFFGRIAPAKRAGMFVEALVQLHEQGVAFTASVVGSALPHDEGYATDLHARTAGIAKFIGGVKHADAPLVFESHEIYVNTSPSGMLDKTMFEAAASGCLVLAASEDWKVLAGEEYYFTDVATLKERIQACMALSAKEKTDAQTHMRTIAEAQSLTILADRLVKELHTT